MKTKVRKIPIDLIHPNLRLTFRSESIEELCFSIELEGLREPILTWFDGARLRILDGEKRWRACKMLGIVRIEASIVEITSVPQTRISSY